MATTIEAFVEAGQIRLPEGIRLPEKAQVYIVVPSLDEVPRAISFETRKISQAEYQARGAEIDATYADFPDEEEAATMRLMRSKAAKVARRETW